MSTFEELAESRRRWIDEVLKPWCARAPLVDLKKAAGEWNDIAGRVDAESTLWSWAWGRFPLMVHEGLAGVDETYEVEVTLKDGKKYVGFPDARSSSPGQLVLHCSGENQPQQSEPYSIDDILSVARC